MPCLPLPVYLIPEHSGTLEGDDLSGWEHDGLTGLGISAPAFLLFAD
jgi:hypothetical protein